MALSALFPHPDYAEDQPLSHTILTTHVLHRGLQVGAIIGLPIFLVQQRKVFFNRSSLPTTSRAVLTPTLARTVGRSGIIGAAFVGFSLLGKAYNEGWEEISWKDRSWRLLENKGQTKIDDWSVGGMILAGTAAVTARTLRRPQMLRGLGVQGAAGVLALGSLAGMVGMAISGPLRERKSVKAGGREMMRNVTNVEV